MISVTLEPNKLDGKLTYELEKNDKPKIAN